MTRSGFSNGIVVVVVEVVEVVASSEVGVEVDGDEDDADDDKAMEKDCGFPTREQLLASDGAKAKVVGVNNARETIASSEAFMVQYGWILIIFDVG